MSLPFLPFLLAAPQTARMVLPSLLIEAGDRKDMMEQEERFPGIALSQPPAPTHHPVPKYLIWSVGCLWSHRGSLVRPSQRVTGSSSQSREKETRTTLSIKSTISLSMLGRLLAASVECNKHRKAPSHPLPPEAGLARFPFCYLILAFPLSVSEGRTHCPRHTVTTGPTVCPEVGFFLLT